MEFKELKKGDKVLVKLSDGEKLLKNGKMKIS